MANSLKRINQLGAKLEKIGKQLSIAFGLGACMVFFNKPFVVLLDNAIVKPIVSLCPNKSLGADIAVLILFICSARYVLLRRKLTPTVKSVSIVTTILVLYLIYFRVSPHYTFYRFYLFEHLYYVDVFVLSGLVLLLSFRAAFPELVKPNSPLSLIEDSPHPNQYVDLLNYGSYAKSLAGNINASTSLTSFGVAVVGNWGSGKTDFLMRLKEELERNEENILFEFNPWRVNKHDAIADEFFKTLTAKLRPFNQGIANKIKDYSSRVLKNSKDVRHRLLDTLIDELIPNKETIDEKYHSINVALKQTGKRFIALIDDVDRLTGKEVMEVLRLIRNTANFSNVVFVVGIDQNYVTTVLKKTNDFTNETEYLKKIFQLTIVLPSYRKERFAEAIAQQIGLEKFEEKYRNKIEKALYELSYFFLDTEEKQLLGEEEYLIEGLLENIRDLKRFCNSFKVTFHTSSLRDDADLHDLIVLELIKNKSIVIYEKIRQRVLIQDDLSGKYSINESEWKNLEDILKSIHTAPEFTTIKKAVRYLIEDKPYKTFRKFSQPHNHYIYFSYTLFDEIPISTFSNLIEQETSVIFEKFLFYAKSNTGERELTRILEGFDGYKTEVTFKNVVSAVLLVEANIHHNFFHLANWYTIAESMLFTKRFQFHRTVFNQNKALQKNVIVDILKNKELEILPRASIANKFLREKVLIDNYDGEEALLLLKKAEWQTLLIEMFEEQVDLYRANSFRCFRKVMRLYYLNIDSIVNQAWHTHPIALNTKFKNLLLTDDFLFKGYLSIVIAEPTFAEHGAGIFAFEGCLTEIFGDWQCFKDRLETMDFADNDFKQLREIVLKYGKQNQFSISPAREKQFLVSEDENKFLLNWWRKIYRELNIDPWGDANS